MGSRLHRYRKRKAAAVAIIITATFIGFFVGIRQLSHDPEYRTFAPTDEGHAALARTNEQLATQPWSTELPRWMPSQSSGQTAVIAAVTPANRQAYTAAMNNRAQRRAFEGAPPTIPHPVGQGSAVECQVCHQRGVRIGSASAPPISHATYTMCTQCHVAEASPVSPYKESTPAGSVESDFRGKHTSPAPYRHAAGSPPQMPHATFMREKCISCHGPNGSPGLQTSHPERQVCQQCHTPSAVVDQQAIQ